MPAYSLLLVDDDEELLESFSRWFSSRGFDVTTAHHPSLAIVSTAYKKFDAAVIDITLPEMNGIELIDQLKAIGDFPIIVLSGNDSPELLAAATQRGVFQLLVKPVAMSVLETAVHRSIEESTSTVQTSL